MFSRVDVYWIQTDKQTDRQAKCTRFHLKKFYKTIEMSLKNCHPNIDSKLLRYPQISMSWDNRP